MNLVNTLIRILKRRSKESVSVLYVRQSKHNQHFDPLHSPVEVLIETKHHEYTSKARFYKVIYYATRLSMGLCSGTLPFVVWNYPLVATCLSLIIIISTVTETAFQPKERWSLYSKASDLLMIEKLKIAGAYDKYKGILDVLTDTESKVLETLVSLQKVKEEVKEVASKPSSLDIEIE